MSGLSISERFAQFRDQVSENKGAAAQGAVVLGIAGVIGGALAGNAAGSKGWGGFLGLVLGALLGGVVGVKMKGSDAVEPAPNQREQQRQRPEGGPAQHATTPAPPSPERPPSAAPSQAGGSVRPAAPPAQHAPASTATEVRSRAGSAVQSAAVPAQPAAAPPPPAPTPAAPAPAPVIASSKPPLAPMGKYTALCKEISAEIAAILASRGDVLRKPDDIPSAEEVAQGYSPKVLTLGNVTVRIGANVEVNFDGCRRWMALKPGEETSWKGEARKLVTDAVNRPPTRAGPAEIQIVTDDLGAPLSLEKKGNAQVLTYPGATLEVSGEHVAMFLPHPVGYGSERPSQVTRYESLRDLQAILTYLRVENPGHFMQLTPDETAMATALGKEFPACRVKRTEGGVAVMQLGNEIEVYLVPGTPCFRQMGSLRVFVGQGAPFSGGSPDLPAMMQVVRQAVALELRKIDSARLGQILTGTLETKKAESPNDQCVYVKFAGGTVTVTSDRITFMNGKPTPLYTARHDGETPKLLAALMEILRTASAAASPAARAASAVPLARAQTA